MLTIRNGRVQGVPFKPARCFGGAITPELIILHDTAGRLDRGNSVAWFQSRECKTSAHFVIERDGSIVQMVPCDRKAFHAGKSSWAGRVFCNSFSIGIEIVNPGKMDASGRAWFGAVNCPGAQHCATREHGDGYWLPYTPEQIAAVKDLCRAIVVAYPSCNEIATHWAVSPGRKVDTNPLLPLDAIRSHALGGDDDEGDSADPPSIGPAHELPPASMMQSSEGQAALATGSGSGLSFYQGTQNAVMRAASTGTLTVRAVILAMLAEPLVWAGAAGLFGAAYWWLKRADKRKRGV